MSCQQLRGPPIPQRRHKVAGRPSGCSSWAGDPEGRRRGSEQRVLGSRRVHRRPVARVLASHGRSPSREYRLKRGQDSRLPIRVQTGTSQRDLGLEAIQWTLVRCLREPGERLDQQRPTASQPAQTGRHPAPKKGRLRSTESEELTRTRSLPSTGGTKADPSQTLYVEGNCEGTPSSSAKRGAPPVQRFSALLRDRRPVA